MKLSGLIVAVFLFCSAAGQESSKSAWAVSERRGNVELFSQVPIDANLVWMHLVSVNEELEEVTGIRGTQDPVRVLIFADQKSYLKSIFPRVPSAQNRKAVFVKEGQLSTLFLCHSRDLIADLRHEMVHATIHQHLPFLPLWMDEGLAEYFEEPPEDRDGSSRARSVRWRARLRQSTSLATLEKMRSADLMSPEEYRDSWAWVCFLLHESPETSELLKDYVRRIHAGESPLRFSEFSVQTTGALDQRFNAWFRKTPPRSQ